MLIGIVGKPNAGKSTFFAAATLKPVEIAPYAFTTIEPNTGEAFVRVKCPHLELGRRCNPKRGFCINGTRFVPVKLLDVAGLVPGAHKGRGLGNKFLDDMRRAEVLIFVVDASGTTDLEGNPGQGNPVEEIAFLEAEIDFWLLGIFQRFFERQKNRKKEEIKEKLLQLLAGLEMKKPEVIKLLENMDWQINGIEDVRLLRKTAKPIVIAANKYDREEAKKWVEKLKKAFDYLVVPVSAEIELLLKRAWKAGLIEYIPGSSSFKITGKPTKEQEKALEIAAKYLEENRTTGVQEALERAVFDLAGYIPVFPVENENTWEDSTGKVLPDCFLVKKGTTARDLAYMIHTEIGQRFINAVDARRKIFLAADYILKPGDVIKINFSRR